jgi:hypothetical protein
MSNEYQYSKINLRPHGPESFLLLKRQVWTVLQVEKHIFSKHDSVLCEIHLLFIRHFIFIHLCIYIFSRMSSRILWKCMQKGVSWGTVWSSLWLLLSLYEESGLWQGCRVCLKESTKAAIKCASVHFNNANRKVTHDLHENRLTPLLRPVINYENGSLCYNV